jgi:CheY-like chemotaxis protein
MSECRQKRAVDLIILDVMMPMMDGLRFAGKRLRLRSQLFAYGER